MVKAPGFSPEGGLLVVSLICSANEGKTTEHRRIS